MSKSQVKRITTQAQGRIEEQQAEIDRLRGLLREWVSVDHLPDAQCAMEINCGICLECRTRKELEPTDGS